LQPALLFTLNVTFQSHPVCSTLLPALSSTDNFSSFFFLSFFFPPQVCISMVLFVAVAYWALLFPSLHKPATFYNVCVHAINVPMFYLEFYFNAHPVDRRHCPIPICWAGVYVIYAWIHHAAGGLKFPYFFINYYSPFDALWCVGITLGIVVAYQVPVYLTRFKKEVKPFSDQDGAELTAL
jgi:hypothetical protein